MKHTSTDNLTTISKELLDFIWSSSPVDATMLGVHEYDGTFGDLSPEALRNRRHRFRQFTTDLASKVDSCNLSPQQFLEYELCITLSEKGAVHAQCERAWERDPSWYAHMMVWGCVITCLRNSTPLDERLSMMLSRMRQIPELLFQARSNLSNPHYILVSIATDILNNGISFFEEVVPGLAFTAPHLQGELLNATGKAADSLKQFGDWLRRHVIPIEDESYAIGHAGYQQLLFAEHRLTYTPKDLLKLAYSAIEDAEEQIIYLAAQIDPSVTWRELVELLDYECPGPDTLIDVYRSATESARRFVAGRQIATIPEEASLNVSWTPEAARSMIPYAACFPPPPFGANKNGELWVNPPNYIAPEWVQMAQLQGHCIHQIPIIALHEGYPGHYLQFAAQFDKASPVAKQMCSSLSIEGWASYCEQMMYEEGFYTAPKVQLFHLRNVLSDAARVIVDVAIHTEGMPLNDAADFLVEKACFQLSNAVTEVRRCVQHGTQSVANLVGKMLILDLRQRMKMQLGNNFNLKSFHDRLLSYGAIPPSLVAKEMLTCPLATKTK